jgi:hypothetical protein
MFKKFLLSLAFISCLYGGLSGLNLQEVQSETAFASNPKIEKKTLDFFKAIEKETGLQTRSDANFDGDVRAAGVSNVVNLLNAIIGIMKYLAYGLLLLFATIAIVQMIAGGDDISDSYEKNKGYLINAVMAVGIILTADVIFNDVFQMGSQNFASSTQGAKAAASRLSAELGGITNFIEMISGALAVMMFVFAGFNLTINAVDENASEKAKKQIQYGVMGLLVILVAETLVKRVLFAESSTIDAAAAKELIVSLTNFTAGFITTVSLLAFFYAGYLYVFRGIEDSGDKIKQTITGAVSGILIAAAAFGIVNTVITLDTTDVLLPGERSNETINMGVGN